MSGMKNATIETNNDTNESAMLRKNMLPLDILLGKNVKTWHQLKEAVGIAGDSDMLIRLMSFFVDAQGIDLSESPSVQPDVEPAREPEPEPEPVGASSFIVIHRADQMHRGGDAQMRVAARKLQIKNEDGLDVWRPGDDDYMAPLQYDRRKPRQRRPGAAPRLRGVLKAQDAVAHALDGMLWREAVFRGRPMPLDDVRLLVRTDGERTAPTVLPWDGTAPVLEHHAEAAPLAQLGCGLCPRLGFSSRADLMAHLWLRHPQTRERYPTQFVTSKQLYELAHCTLCFGAGSLTAGRRDAFLQHWDACHVTCQMASEHAAHVCDVCLAEFGREEDRDRHVAETHARHVPQQRTCGTCGACVRGTQNYIRHLRVHYTEYKFACNWCPNFRSRDADTMQAHLETHERRFLRCGLCTFHTRTFRTATDHLRVHLQLPLHVCATCGYRAYSSSRYFNHLDSHGGRRHRCNICNAEFTSLLRKARHKTLVHRRPAAFTCERCGLVLSSTFRLRRHQASHTGHKPFRCQLCGKRLSSRQSLQNHARVCPENDEPFRAAAVVEVVTT